MLCGSSDGAISSLAYINVYLCLNAINLKIKFHKNSIDIYASVFIYLKLNSWDKTRRATIMFFKCTLTYGVTLLQMLATKKKLFVHVLFVKVFCSKQKKNTSQVPTSNFYGISQMTAIIVL